VGEAVEKAVEEVVKQSHMDWPDNNEDRTGVPLLPCLGMEHMLTKAMLVEVLKS
jgi:hypothetical protein